MPQSLLSVLFAVLMVFGGPSLPVLAAELEALHGATLVEDDLNDGDSFKVMADGRELHLRLYYVDCLETTYDANQERVRAQQGYFGLDEPDAVMRFGGQATEHVQQVLSRPFTVYTSNTPVMRGSAGRVYAFVKTHDGHDLGHLLVERGLARIYGKRRPSPDGLRSDQVLVKLGCLQDRAMQDRAGIWAETNPDFFDAKRKCLREEGQKQKEFRKNQEDGDTPSTTNPMDLNHASKEQLESIPGIGPVLSTQIIIGRCWVAVDDLLQISGIGKKMLEKIAPYLTVGRQPNSRQEA